MGTLPLAIPKNAKEACMNVWKPVAIVSSSLLAVVLACGGAQVAERSAAADQPHMVAAREHLLQARASLDRAEPNKGGHREHAIELVDRAIQQVNEGIEYARNH
jgi:hypothetical protein